MKIVRNIFPKIRNEKGDISDNSTESKRLLRKCYKQLNEHTFKT